MRVLQLAPAWEAVPPLAYGGTEAVVHVLVEGLVRAGVGTALYASGDSRTSAELRSIVPCSLRTASVNDKNPHDWMHVANALRHANEFDLVHNHAGALGMAMSHLIDVPMLTTMHCAVTGTEIVWDNYSGWYNTISHAQERGTPAPLHARSVGVVYNSIDVESFPFSAEKDDYLLFLSRIAPEKGTHLAIEAARRSGIRLVLAAKVDVVDREYFSTQIEPLIDGRGVVFVGEADSTAKRRLYERARGLLLPLQWEEPFGLVMAEAMACGTPVIAFDRGAAAEIVGHGETGFLVEGVEGMVEAIQKLHSIDAHRCRQRVTERFAPEVMVRSYLACYDTVLAGRSRTLPADSHTSGRTTETAARA